MGLFDSFKRLFSSQKSEIPSWNINQSHSNEPDLKSKPSLTNENETEFVDKTKEFLSNTIDEVKEQGSFLWNEVKEKVVDLDEATKEYRERLAEKAKETLESIDHFVDETVEKAKKLSDIELEKDKDQDGFADKPIDFGKDLSEKQEGFFNKAEKWLDHSEVNKPQNESGNATSNQKTIQPVELPPDPETKL